MDNPQITITLTDEEWSQVVHAIIICQRTEMRLPGLTKIGRAITDAAPKGSATWFGHALLERE